MIVRTSLAALALLAFPALAQQTQPVGLPMPKPAAGCGVPSRSQLNR